MALEARDLRISMTLTDQTDALGDLARAIISLMEGSLQASIVLEDNPGIHEWEFRREDGTAHLRIHSWADRGSGEDALVLSQERTVSLVCQLPALAREMILVLEVLRVGHDPEDWGRLSPRHPFPGTELRRLHQLMAIQNRKAAEWAASSRRKPAR